jgi:hypothetical protein
VIILAGALLVGLLVVGYVVLSRGGSSGVMSQASDQPQAVVTAGAQSAQDATPATATVIPEVSAPAAGLGTPMPDEGNAHVADGTVIIYKNYPPSSGPHYNTTAPYGFYEQSVPEGNFVHNLEHGAVVLYYKPDVPDEVKKQLRDLMTMLPREEGGDVRMLIVPYTKMPTPLAIAAWDRLLLINEFNFDEIRAFYQEWVNRGPERVP